MSIHVIRSSYEGRGRRGDFEWMIEQPEYSRTLFVFNDNEDQFREHQRLLGTPHRCTAGGGNAVIRPQQCMTPPRATGIPTGRRGGGYASLADALPAVDAAISHLDHLLGTGDYDALAFSWNDDTQTLGVRIFAPHRDVLDYIVEQIDLTAARH